MRKSRQVGILAFGSLILDPGPELAPRIVKRIKAQTPFPIEFAKYSSMRGGAPTLTRVTHGGEPVDAVILVLEDGISESEAMDMLWRRETGNVGTRKRYTAARSPRAVRVLRHTEYEGVSGVLYTDFYARGKVSNPKPATLARRAIRSVHHAENGKDGISYLIQAMRSGISTPLMATYESEILRLTDTDSLTSALTKLQSQRLPRPG